MSVVGRTTPDFVDRPVRRLVRHAASRSPRSPGARCEDVRCTTRSTAAGRAPVGVREWQGGERYGDTHDDYYAEFRGTVTGAEAGDQVEVWFTGRKRGAGPVASEHFTYTVARRHRRRRAGPRRRGRHRRSARRRPRDQRQVRRRARRGAHRGRLHQRRLRLRHPGPQGAAPPRRAVALQGGGLGDRRRHHPAGAGPGGRHDDEGRAGHRAGRPRLPQRGRQAAARRQVRAASPRAPTARTSTTRLAPPECTDAATT